MTGDSEKDKNLVHKRVYAFLKNSLSKQSNSIVDLSSRTTFINFGSGVLKGSWAEQISEWNSAPFLVDRVAFPLSSLSLQASAIDWELSTKCFLSFLWARCQSR